MTTTTETAVDAVERGIRAGEVTAKEVEHLLSVMVNGARSQTIGAFADALSNDHPTLSASIAKAVAIGIMRRCRYDPEWRAFDPLWKDGEPICTEPPTWRPLDEFGGGMLPKHKVHDGRIDCQTVIGAMLMSRQSYI